MSNLMAEMTRYGVTILAIQRVLGCTEKTVRNKINGVSEFSIIEAFKIRDTYFPGMTLEYLFAQGSSTSST